MSDYAQEQRRLHESSRPKRSTTSDFASEPDEETFTFGPQTPEPVLPSSEPGSSLDSSGMPSSNNALRLSDVPPRRVKRKFSDSEPDEEVLEFGRPAQEIKRAKTSSPASIISHHGTPANIVAESPSESALSPQARPPALYQSIPSRSSAAGMAAYGTKLVHGSSPLATAAVLSSNSGSEDESEDSEYEGVVSSQAVNHAVPVGDGDTEEDDFLAAALQDDAASNHSGVFCFAFSHTRQSLGDRVLFFLLFLTVFLQMIRATKATTRNDKLNVQINISQVLSRAKTACF